MAAELGYADISGYLQETAEWWNTSLERWVYVQDTALARELGVDGYYADVISSGAEARGKNSGPGNLALAGEARIQISPDVLALVRFGLRAADDPRILSSVKALDAMLRCETPFGPCWYRYKGDKYGEKADGSPFDGSGQGRLWPLLTGERAHYELAAGRPEEARRLAQTMAAFSSSTLLLPEQVWDQDDKPEFGLYKGRPTGSAMPLVWAHAEYMKLCRSLDEGRVFDLPALLKKHFQHKERKSVLPIWSFQNKMLKLAHCNRLRIETTAPALVHWSLDHWVHSHDSQTRDTDLSVHVVDIPIKTSTRSVIFTFFWPESGHWEGRDYEVEVEGPQREGKAP
jgi:glucoamylase